MLISLLPKTALVHRARALSLSPPMCESSPSVVLLAVPSFDEVDHDHVGAISYPQYVRATLRSSLGLAAPRVVNRLSASLASSAASESLSPATSVGGTCGVDASADVSMAGGSGTLNQEHLRTAVAAIGFDAPGDVVRAMCRALTTCSYK